MFEAALATQRDCGGDRRFDTRVGHIKLRIRVKQETGVVWKHWSQAAKTGMKTGS